MMFHIHPMQTLKIGKDPGIFGAWLDTHNLHRGTNEEKICSQRTADHWEDFDKALTNAHGENWEVEHPDLDGQSSMKQQGGPSRKREQTFEAGEQASSRHRACCESLAKKGGVDFDGIMQSTAADLSTSDSKGGFRWGRGDVHQNETEKGMGNRTRGSTSHGNDDEDDYYGN